MRNPCTSCVDESFQLFEALPVGGNNLAGNVNGSLGRRLKDTPRSPVELRDLDGQLQAPAMRPLQIRYHAITLNLYAELLRVSVFNAEAAQGPT